MTCRRDLVASLSTAIERLSFEPQIAAESKFDLRLTFALSYVVLAAGPSARPGSAAGSTAAPAGPVSVLRILTNVLPRQVRPQPVDLRPIVANKENEIFGCEVA